MNVAKVKANRSSKTRAGRNADILPEDFADRLVAGNRAILGRAITLIESRSEKSG